MSARTVRDFTVSTDIWPIVAAWATRSKYRVQRSSESTVLYHKSGMMLEISQTGGQVHMEAWVKAGWIRYLGLLYFVQPAEMGIESGGWRQPVVRRMERSAVNELLNELGQPPIE